MPDSSGEAPTSLVAQCPHSNLIGVQEGRDEVAHQQNQAQHLKKKMDLLDLLLSARYDDGSQLTDLELRDECMTLILAGEIEVGSSFRMSRHLQACCTLVSAYGMAVDLGFVFACRA